MKKVSAVVALVVFLFTSVFATESITVDSKFNIGNKRVVIGTISYINETYYADGMSLTASDLGLYEIDFIVFSPALQSTNSKYKLVYDIDDEDFELYYEKNSGDTLWEWSEYADSTNFTGSWRFMAIGK